MSGRQDDKFNLDKIISEMARLSGRDSYKESINETSKSDRDTIFSLTTSGSTFNRAVGEPINGIYSWRDKSSLKWREENDTDDSKGCNASMEKETKDTFQLSGRMKKPQNTEHLTESKTISGNYAFKGIPADEKPPLPPLSWRKKSNDDLTLNNLADQDFEHRSYQTVPKVYQDNKTEKPDTKRLPVVSEARENQIGGKLISGSNKTETIPKSVIRNSVLDQDVQHRSYQTVPKVYQNKKTEKPDSKRLPVVSETRENQAGGKLISGSNKRETIPKSVIRNSGQDGASCVDFYQTLRRYTYRRNENIVSKVSRASSEKDVKEYPKQQRTYQNKMTPVTLRDASVQHVPMKNNSCQTKRFPRRYKKKENSAEKLSEINSQTRPQSSSDSSSGTENQAVNQLSKQKHKKKRKYYKRINRKTKDSATPGTSADVTTEAPAYKEEANRQKSSMPFSASDAAQATEMKEAAIVQKYSVKQSHNVSSTVIQPQISDNRTADTYQVLMEKIKKDPDLEFSCSVLKALKSLNHKSNLLFKVGVIESLQRVLPPHMVKYVAPQYWLNTPIVPASLPHMYMSLTPVPVVQPTQSMLSQQVQNTPPRRAMSNREMFKARSPPRRTFF